MMPGRINPKQLNQMMRRLGINVKTIEDVEKVVIQTPSKEYIFEDAEVSLMEAQGQKTYQIIGEPTVRTREQASAEGDVALVVQQTGKTADEARKALKETNGDIAEAILKLSA